MPTRDLTTRQQAAVLLAGGIVLALIIIGGLLLREHGPGNMGTGFLQGAAVGVAGAGLAIWRVSRDPEGATVFERAFTQTGDERDDAILTRTLAVLGLLSFPLTAAAAIAVGLGIDPMMAFCLLLFGELAVGAVAFTVIARTS